MTTGQVALYSVCIGHTQDYSFGGSHEHLLSAGREEITIVFVFAGSVRHLYGADADTEFQSVFCTSLEHILCFLTGGFCRECQRASRHPGAASARRTNPGFGSVVA